MVADEIRASYRGGLRNVYERTLRAYLADLGGTLEAGPGVNMSPTSATRSIPSACSTSARDQRGTGSLPGGLTGAVSSRACGTFPFARRSRTSQPRARCQRRLQPARRAGLGGRHHLAARAGASCQQMPRRQLGHSDPIVAGGPPPRCPRTLRLSRRVAHQMRRPTRTVLTIGPLFRVQDVSRSIRGTVRSCSDSSGLARSESAKTRGTERPRLPFGAAPLTSEF
jgi:hypothetical protein